MSTMTQNERDAVMLLVDFRNRVVSSDDFPFEKDSSDVEGAI